MIYDHNDGKSIWWVPMWVGEGSLWESSVKYRHPDCLPNLWDHIIFTFIITARHGNVDNILNLKEEQAHKSSEDTGKLWVEKVWAQNTFIDFLAELDELRK